MRALGNIGPKASLATAELIDIVEYESALEFQIEAARALGKIGPDAQEAVSSLISICNYVHLGGNWTTTDAIVAAAAEALKTIDPSIDPWTANAKKE